MLTLKTKQDNFIRAQYDLIQPIILTEEWLIKFGFRLMGVAKWKCCYNQIARTDKTYAQSIFYNEEVPELEIDVILSLDETELRRIGIKGINVNRAEDIKYVHEFQNWWYLITGTELKIKE